MITNFFGRSQNYQLKGHLQTSNLHSKSSTLTMSVLRAKNPLGQISWVCMTCFLSQMMHHLSWNKSQKGQKLKPKLSYSALQKVQKAMAMRISNSTSFYFSLLRTQLLSLNYLQFQWFQLLSKLHWLIRKMLSCWILRSYQRSQKPFHKGEIQVFVVELITLDCSRIFLNPRYCHHSNHSLGWKWTLSKRCYINSKVHYFNSKRLQTSSKNKWTTPIKYRASSVYDSIGKIAKIGFYHLPMSNLYQSLCYWRTTSNTH